MLRLYNKFKKKYGTDSSEWKTSGEPRVMCEYRPKILDDKLAELEEIANHNRIDGWMDHIDPQLAFSENIDLLLDRCQKGVPPSLSEKYGPDWQERAEHFEKRKRQRRREESANQREQRRQDILEERRNAQRQEAERKRDEKRKRIRNKLKKKHQRKETRKQRLKEEARKQLQRKKPQLQAKHKSLRN